MKLCGRRAEAYADVVKSAWTNDVSGPSTLHATWANLNRLAGSLKDWSRSSFGSVRMEIQRLEKILRSLPNATVSEAGITEERRVER